MAKKLRTGFELPFSNATGSEQVKLVNPVDYFKDIVTSVIRSPSTDDNLTYLEIQSTLRFLHTTTARTLSNGTRGVCVQANAGDDQFNYLLAYDVSLFSGGVFENRWINIDNFNSTGNYLKLFYINNGTNYYLVYLQNGSTPNLVIVEDGTTNRASTTISLSADTWYNLKVSYSSAGVITADLNGTSINYDTTIAFSNVTEIAGCGSCYHSSDANRRLMTDDLAVNDGSGASDNTMPNSIRGYNFFDSATLNTNSGFSQVGGSGILANLQDGDDTTRVSAQADLSFLDFSLPTLSGTGMSETSANFANIQSINIYGRQIEATKASSVLKAKITDTVAVVDREEDLSLPLTVGNNSLFYPDDDTTAWVLANLDSGDFDFRVTFDKP